MCQFNYLTLAPSADVQAIRTIARSFGKKLDPVPSHVLVPLLRPGETLYATASKHCDCGSAVGSAAHQVTSPVADLDREADKLAAKGWSKSKIARWRSDRLHAIHRDDEHRRNLQEHIAAEAALWCELLANGLKSSAARWIGLIHTWEGEGWRELRETFSAVDMNLDALGPTNIVELPRFRLCRVIR